MSGLIAKELRNHAPFTLFGAATGIIIIFLFVSIPEKTAYNIFYTLHPLHVFLSALTTASIYKKYRFEHSRGNRAKFNVVFFILIGYTGAIGIATLGDSLIPYIGEILLDMPRRQPHIGFIEKWWLVNPLAAAGIAAAYFRPSTKFPHMCHVLISTWASLFHIIMADAGGLGIAGIAALFVFLFLAVWLPCCVSDIVFPLLFVKEGKNK
ncbi:MAG: hypothetical protein ACLFP1_07300 [Candidatus Goldiibacteriota bacterium]